MATPSFRLSRLSATPRAQWNNRPCAARQQFGDGRRNVPCRRVRTWARHLVIMVKVPEAGRVKTRLAREVGTVAATAFYRQASAGLIARLGHDPRWTTHLAVAPDTAARAACWPLRLARRQQGSGDLGRRMQAQLDRMPPGPVVIIGSDCPAVRASDIAAAFAALGDADVVVGPAEDGGYWLIGERRTPKPLPAFNGVRWSSENALTDTLANFKNYRVARVRTVSDVDTAADLAREGHRGSRRIRGAG
jgi:rSAM/selenodomain-associated transferase 1